jgi:hypothetical protein
MDEKQALTPEAVKELAEKLNQFVVDTMHLYWSDKEISEELAAALGEMWEICGDYVEMYENISRI